jgi:hypothetical protein
MRFLLIVAAYAALTVSCFAQVPQELTGASTIRLHPGESKLLTTRQPFAKFHLTDEGIVQVSVDTDQAFVLRGLKSGSVVMSIYRPDGSLIERSTVVVAGGLVRIYGTSTGDEKKSDYIGYICSETGCGRADPEVDKPEAQQTTVTRTRRNSRGDLITTTTRD